MDIREQLLLEHSKANSCLIRDYIGEDKKKFEELLQLFLAEEYRISQRAAMVISACFDENPVLVNPYRAKLIENLLDREVNIAVKRNTIRILQFMEIPEKYKARMYDYCLAQLHSENEAIAVKAFAMQVAYNLCEDFPELKSELIEAIQLNLDTTDSAGVRARGKNILKKLNKI